MTCHRAGHFLFSRETEKAAVLQPYIYAFVCLFFQIRCSNFQRPQIPHPSAHTDSRKPAYAAKTIHPRPSQPDAIGAIIRHAAAAIPHRITGISLTARFLARKQSRSCAIHTTTAIIYIRKLAFMSPIQISNIGSTSTTPEQSIYV